MENQIFREKSLEQISSPEQMNDYLRVTNPVVWLMLAAIILLLAGMLLWSTIASVDSFASGTAQVESGKMVITFDDYQIASNVESGMQVTTGEVSATISSVGTTADGRIFALADTSLADGVYPVKVVYKQTQIIRLLFN